MLRSVIVLVVLWASAPGLALTAQAESENLALPNKWRHMPSLQNAAPLLLAGLGFEVPKSDCKNLDPCKPTGEKRAALVIGNNNYADHCQQKNAIHDAEVVAQTLRAAGFDTVEVGTDLSRPAMLEALRRFEDITKDVDWAVIYYAGLGGETRGENYLLPIDAPLDDERRSRDEGVTLGRVASAVSRARKLRAVLIDSCKFALPLQPQGTPGVLFAFAAKSKQACLDTTPSTPDHSPFAAALIRHIPTPGLNLRKLFQRVREDVLIATDGKQEPVLHGDIPVEDISFKAK